MEQDRGLTRQASILSSVAYALPMVGVYFFVAPISILQGIYAKYFGVPLTTIAAIILAARLFDAVSDPLIGYISDQEQARTGGRKRMIAIGGAVFVVSAYFLYAPPEDVGALYFLVFFILFALGFTLIEIPHLAWGGALASDLKGRTRIFTFRHVAVYSGTFLFYVAPLMPFFDGTEITPETLKWSAVVMGSFLVPALIVALVSAPSGQSASATQAPRLSALWTAIVENRPLLLFLAVYFCAGLGLGMFYGLLFIFVDAYLGLGQYISFVYMVALGASLLATAGWYVAATRFGKKQSWAVGIGLSGSAAVATLFLNPGEGALIPLYVIVTVSQIGMASMVIAPSILADISDYGHWKFGANRSATYFSAYTLVTKGNAAFGAALGFAIAGLFGFDPTVSEHSDESVFGLRLVMSYAPTLIIAIGVAFAIFMPMNARRHAIVRRRLEAREHRRGATSSDQQEQRA